MLTACCFAAHMRRCCRPAAAAGSPTGSHLGHTKPQ
jgi:hypothetical protein